MDGVPVAGEDLLDQVVAASPYPALVAVGRIHVGRRAFRHRHFLECQALTQVFDADAERVERVIGTANKERPRAQLYGWGRNVAPHRDGTGWIYLAPLLLGRSMLFAGDLSLELEAGVVYRMNDFARHWTMDDAPVVCLFAGVFDHPQDGRALRMLRRGALQLGLRDRHAPRVSQGFRVPMRGECYADPRFCGERRLCRLAMAERKGWVVADCALCGAPAVRLDTHWPYLGDYNRCGSCLDRPD